MPRTASHRNPDRWASRAGEADGLPDRADEGPLIPRFRKDDFCGGVASTKMTERSPRRSPLGTCRKDVLEASAQPHRDEELSAC